MVKDHLDLHLLCSPPQSMSLIRLAKSLMCNHFLCFSYGFTIEWQNTVQTAQYLSTDDFMEAGEKYFVFVFGLTDSVEIRYWLRDILSHSYTTQMFFFGFFFYFLLNITVVILAVYELFPG